MGGTYLTMSVGMSVIRSENLPDELDADGVRDEVRAVVEKALDAWYAERGHELLRGPPLVA